MAFEGLLNHNIRSRDGKTIVMPAYKGGQTGWGNLSLPNAYVFDTVQKYPIGTKFVDDDRIFRYCFSTSGITRGRAGAAYGAFAVGGGTTQESATIAAAAAAGATTITHTVQGTVVVANEFAGGYVICSGAAKSIYRIVSHTGASASSTITITLDRAIITAIGAAENIQLVKDQYAEVRGLSGGTDQGWGSFVAVPAHTVAAGRYFWGQTWGPASLALVDNYGQSINERAMFFNIDGTVEKGQATSYLFQYAGFLLPYTGPGPTGTDMAGAWGQIFLQIAP